MLSKKISKRFHMKEPLLDASSYVVTIRNPVDRIKSWFLYEHPKNFRKTIQKQSKSVLNQQLMCGQIMLYNCYDQLDHLASFGLRLPLPSKKNLTHPKVRVNLTQEECSVWAWGAIQGTIATTYHNYWNYHCYLHRNLAKQNTLLMYLLYDLNI